MATNQKGDYIAVWQKSVVCSHPTTPLSGYPVRIGAETGVALTNESTAGTDLSGNATGYTTVDVGPGRWKLSVKGVNDAGNVAVADGDALYYVDADIGSGTGFLSKKRSGYFYGYAREVVTSGSTTSILVDHYPGVAPGTLNSSASQATGFIPLPLAQARLIASSDIAAKGTPDGGTISLDTDPTFKRINGATDKNSRIAWAASSVIPIQWSIAYPPDLDDTSTLTVHLLCGMAGASDTPVIGVAYFEGVGDTNAGGNTAALAATVADKTVVITAANLGTYPNSATIELIPAAHGSDALYLYAAWITYNRI